MARFGRRGASDRLKQRDALKGPHWGATMATNTPTKFEVGQSVRIKRNSAVAKVTDDTNFGYKLEGYNGYFDANAIEAL